MLSVLGLGEVERDREATLSFTSRVVAVVVVIVELAMVKDSAGSKAGGCLVGGELSGRELSQRFVGPEGALGRGDPRSRSRELGNLLSECVVFVVLSRSWLELVASQCVHVFKGLSRRGDIRNDRSPSVTISP